MILIHFSLAHFHIIFILHPFIDFEILFILRGHVIAGKASNSALPCLVSRQNLQSGAFYSHHFSVLIAVL
jgi:hypothetical protein